MVSGANATEPREETGFGSNPGNLRMFSYVPADLAPGAPLIVVLHGCKQKAVTFARDAGWLALADRSRLALLLPEQKGLPSHLHDVYLFPWVVALWGANSQNACFNRFELARLCRWLFRWRQTPRHSCSGRRARSVATAPRPGARAWVDREVVGSGEALLADRGATRSQRYLYATMGLKLSHLARSC
jgi:hypothetical protein